MAYVYLHQFPDGKYYIGSTISDPKIRWNNGKGYAENQTKVHEAIMKFGWENVTHIVIESPDEAAARNIEATLIKELNTIDNGYNSYPGKERQREAEEELMYYKSALIAMKKLYDDQQEILKRLIG